MRFTLVFVLFATLNLTSLRGQTATAGQGSGGQPVSPSNQPRVPNPNTGTSSAPSPSAVAQRAIFVSGTVAMDDGSPLPSNVDILSVCGARQRIVAHASADGAFAFQWNSTETIFQYADDDDSMSRPQSASSAGVSDSAVGDCELRAASSGYTSSRVDIPSRYSAGNFEVGTIVLHRLAGGEGRVVSVLTLRAPKDALKNFEKGNALVRRNKLNEAAASFQKALASYPRYPDAWFALGDVELRQGVREQARADFRRAMELDAKLVGPWQSLGFMASDESKWEEAAKYLDQAVLLDPTDSSAAWYFNALANYKLRRFDAAERSIRSEIKLNGDRNPGSEFLLGEILIGRDDLKSGADVLRKYIQTWPGSDNVATAKRQLSRIESQLTLAAPPP